MRSFALKNFEMLLGGNFEGGNAVSVGAEPPKRFLLGSRC